MVRFPMIKPQLLVSGVPILGPGQNWLLAALDLFYCRITLQLVNGIVFIRLGSLVGDANALRGAMPYTIVVACFDFGVVSICGVTLGAGRSRLV